jgi:hypothetical protein
MGRALWLNLVRKYGSLASIDLAPFRGGGGFSQRALTSEIRAASSLEADTVQAERRRADAGFVLWRSSFSHLYFRSDARPGFVGRATGARALLVVGS